MINKAQVCQKIALQFGELFSVFENKIKKVHLTHGVAVVQDTLCVFTLDLTSIQFAFLTVGKLWKI